MLLILKVEELIINIKFVQSAQRLPYVPLTIIINYRLYNLVSLALVLAFKLRK